jgi:hypothetical protein
MLTRCALPLPVHLLVDEQHSRCLTDKTYLPTIVSGRVIWHLGYSDAKSAPRYARGCAPRFTLCCTAAASATAYGW